MEWLSSDNRTTIDARVATTTVAAEGTIEVAVVRAMSRMPVDTAPAVVEEEVVAAAAPVAIATCEVEVVPHMKVRTLACRRTGMINPLRSRASKDQSRTIEDAHTQRLTR